MRRPTLSQWGFTLFEIMMATSIFMLLAGAIFTTVGAATKSAALLSQEQIRSRKQDAFIRFCRSGFLALPGEADFELRTRNVGRLGRSVDLVITGASGAFWTGVSESSGSSVVLATIPDGNGTAGFSVARYPARLSPDESLRFLEKTAWVPIYEGLASVQWLFQDPNTQKFVEEWSPGQGRPEFVQLKFTQPGQTPVVSTFRVPKITSRKDKNPKVENPEK